VQDLLITGSEGYRPYFKYCLHEELCEKSPKGQPNDDSTCSCKFRAEVTMGISLGKIFILQKNRDYLHVPY
jgi:hypothetical protein